MRRTFLVALALAALLTGCDAGPVTLTGQQRRLADELVGVFEHGDPAPRYDAVEALGDGRGYTCGTIGFTTSSTEVGTIVAAYVAEVSGSPLARHLPRLRELASQGSGDTSGLDGFPEDWATAAADPVFRAEQDALADRLAFTPALAAARRLGIRTPLGVAVLYDTAVQHGMGDDPDGLPALIGRAGVPPPLGVPERAWLEAFLDARADTLRHPHTAATRETWAASTDRVDALRGLVEDGQDQLDPPLRIEGFVLRGQ
ncbi:chitosanase [Dactylosporangium sp. AC04546]|uniref:chitosanase n=1 Tax=Dactylosporangium sp. AC04546 TaxID=2862460 RepID=UPI001EDEB86A|nr:chitosanase [Dactylosporangium sp. AC04546]WVK79198.1 chitosanase [Dactylosporangium sp. AC04546]